jgi:hypothetical protein
MILGQSLRKKILMILITLCTTFIVLGNAAADSVSSEQILTRIKLRAAEYDEQIQRMNYSAISKTIVKKTDGTVEKTVTSRRMINFEAPDKIWNEYLGMTVNGRALNTKEIAGEIKKSQSKLSMQTPFNPREAPKYRFAVTGQTDFQKQLVWKVEFEPSAQADGLAKGHAYVLPDTYDVVYLEFKPAKLPGSLMSLEAKMDYHNAGNGYWLPLDFHMSMHVKVVFIFTLLEQFIEINEKYEGYKINSMVSSE